MSDNNSKTNRRIRRQAVIGRMEKYVATGQLVNGTPLNPGQVENYKREIKRLKAMN